jgi:hypothetical protein
MVPADDEAAVVRLDEAGESGVAPLNLLSFKSMHIQSSSVAWSADGAEMTQWDANVALWPQPGQSYRDPVGGVVVLILSTPLWRGVLRCDGVAMLPGRPLPCSYHSGIGIGGALRPGRRYRDLTSGLEVRCIRGGNGHLTYAGQAIITA